MGRLGVLPGPPHLLPNIGQRGCYAPQQEGTAGVKGGFAPEDQWQGTQLPLVPFSRSFGAPWSGIRSPSASHSFLLSGLRLKLSTLIYLKGDPKALPPVRGFDPTRSWNVRGGGLLAGRQSPEPRLYLEPCKGRGLFSENLARTPKLRVGGAP